MACLFCNIVERSVRATIVHETESTLAFRDITPVAPTHILVIPKKHIGGIRHLGPEESAIAGAVLLSARAVAQEAGLEDAGYRLVVNDGRAAGQTVHHLHVHVLGGRGFTWPPG